MPLLLCEMYKALWVYKQVYIYYFIIAVPQGENAIKNLGKKKIPPS